MSTDTSFRASATQATGSTGRSRRRGLRRAADEPGGPVRGRHRVPRRRLADACRRWDGALARCRRPARAPAIPPTFGVWIDHFTFPFVGAVNLPGEIGVPLSMLWIVAVMNMVNFLDGLDGLAAGVCAIAGTTFAVLALSLGKVDPAILSAIVAGGCLGFLRHNFFPARIFMGDSGALCLGFILAAVSIQGLLKTASTIVLLLPLLVLAVPIIDTSFVVAKRLKYNQPIYAADRSHLHHRFMNIGYSQRRAALTMWLWCASLAGAALATRFVPFREGGHWHPWGTAAVAAIALFALAYSVFIVYLLEIVKLANPLIRRREREQNGDRERLSA